jgi:hypothetical protein
MFVVLDISRFRKTIVLRKNQSRSYDVFEGMKCPLSSLFEDRETSVYSNLQHLCFRLSICEEILYTTVDTMLSYPYFIA